MKVFKQTNLVRIVILAAMAVLVCPNAILAKPGLDNPSFDLPEDTGGLSGWNTDIPEGGFITVLKSPRFDGPADGTYFALLGSGGLGPYTTLSQPFEALAGNTISGWAFFYAWDYENDYAYVRIIDSGGTVVDVMFYASVSTPEDPVGFNMPGINQVNIIVGAFSATPWTYLGVYIYTARDIHSRGWSCQR